jgi:hypothetical protein
MVIAKHESPADPTNSTPHNSQQPRHTHYRLHACCSGWCRIHGSLSVGMPARIPSNSRIDRECLGPGLSLHRVKEGGEGAFTLIPNFLVTGVIATMLGLMIIVWSICFIRSQFAWARSRVGGQPEERLVRPNDAPPGAGRPRKRADVGGQSCSCKPLGIKWLHWSWEFL